MKICITSQGTDLSAPVDPRFGRARYFVIYEDETGYYDTIDNEQNVNAAGGAGVQAASTVAGADCKWVISGHIGPRALSVLQGADVQVAVGAEGTVQEAIDAFQEGELEEAEGPTTRPHW
jgi:predicted Fe-Mo cluster-binding NifX family protein